MLNRTLPFLRESVHHFFQGKRSIKQITAGIILLFFLNLVSSAQTWQPLGPDDTDWPYLDGTNYISMAVSGNGTPYVVYMDRGMDDKATCRKFNGRRWVNAGMPGFSEGSVAFTSIAINENGIPYVVYQDYAHGYRATVKKLVAGNWVDVGSPGFTEDYSLNTSIAIDDNGTPYVVYVDGFGGHGAITVKKFAGGNWVTVGEPRFSPGYFEAPSIAIDNNGTPYVAYGHGPRVKKFVSGNWIDVGDPGTPTSQNSYARLAINNHGTPYVAYYDITAGAVKVKKFRNGNWTDVGTPGWLALEVVNVYIAIDNNGTPYISYGTYYPPFESRVKKFTGGSWVDVGPPGEAGGILAIDDNGTPYINSLFNDGVKKFNGSHWDVIGNAYSLSATRAGYISVAADANGTPYTVYQDYGNFGKATVMKFNGAYWKAVGNPGFSDDTAWYTSIAIRNNGVPFVVYRDKGNGNKATVKKFSAGNWSNVGSPGFSAGEVAYTSIAINNAGVPYIVYRDDGNEGKATVKKFTAGSWKDVGLPGFSTGAVSYTSLAIDGAGTPYVVYLDEANERKTTVKKFKNGSWQDVGSPGFSTHPVSGTSIAINEWGTPYVVYSSGGGGEVRVMYFFEGEWTELGPPLEVNYQYSIFNIDLVLDSGSDPYVVYDKWGPMVPEVFHKSVLVVKKFNGADWVDIWPSSPAISNISYAAITITPSDIPIVVYNHKYGNLEGAFAKSWGEFNKNPEVFVTGKGYEKTSPAQGIKDETGFSFEVYPNPLQYSSHAQVRLDKNTSLELRIFDIQGKMIWVKQYHLPEGTYSLELPVEKLNAGGVYILEAVLTSGERKTLRIVK